MAKKILLGGLVGGILVFLVMGLFHMATSLGEYGIKTLPNEDSTLSIMRTSVPESGLYLFPAADMSKGSTAASQAAYLEKYRTGPAGFMSYVNPGGDFSFGKLLLNQFLFGMVAAWLVAWILGITANATTYGSRVGIVFAASLFAGCVYPLAYWNWYRFPMSYTAAYIGTWCVGWLIAGLAMAAIVKPTRAASA
jgi:hypothetical protein